MIVDSFKFIKIFYIYYDKIISLKTYGFQEEWHCRIYAGARTLEILCKGSKDHDHPFRIQE